MKSTIIGFNCPFCGELAPVRIDFEGRGVEEGLIQIGGQEISEEGPFTIASILIEIDLDKLKAGGLDELIAQRDREKSIR